MSVAIDDGVTLQQLHAVAAVAATTSALSICGSAAVLALYCALPQLRRFSFSLIALLALIDIVNQLADVAHPSLVELAAMQRGELPVSTACVAQAFVDSIFELASVLSASALAVTMLLQVNLRLRLRDSWRNVGVVAAICLCVPTALTSVAAAQDALGPVGDSCWIVARRSDLRYWCFFAPLWLAILVNTLCYVAVLRRLRHVAARAGPTDAAVASIRSTMTRLNAYPLVLPVQAAA